MQLRSSLMQIPDQPQGKSNQFVHAIILKHWKAYCWSLFTQDLKILFLITLWLPNDLKRLCHFPINMFKQLHPLLEESGNIQADPLMVEMGFATCQC